MADTIVPVGNEVKGDITQCKIETALTKVERNGSLSPTQRESYKSYDVCTKKIVDQYTNSSLTPIGFGLIFIPVIVVVILGMAIFGDGY